MRGNRLICPVCGLPLEKTERTYRCEKGHSYDIAKKGYVNLMMSQSSSKKRHGDDKLMVAARRDFLDKGYYAPLQKAVVEAAAKFAADGAVIIDAGCGEGYYTAAAAEKLPDADIYGIDISKDALIYAAKRSRELTLAAASASDIPIQSGCADVIVSIFAPIFPDEAARLLCDNGVIVRAVPLEEHLFELKKAIYQKAYKNPPDDFRLDGFEIISKEELRYTLTLESSKDIEALFMMTPYYYKTSREDQQRLLERDCLETEAAFGVIVYKKQGSTV